MKEYMLEIDKNFFVDKYYLKNILKITTDLFFKDKFIMNEEEQEILLNSKMHRLKRLDLSKQDIDNSFLIEMSKRGNLRYLNEITIKKNPNLSTGSALDYILNNSDIGYRRDKPIVCGKYHQPKIEIKVFIKDKNIKEKYKTLEKFKFKIKYDDKRITAVNGLKKLLVINI